MIKIKVKRLPHAEGLELPQQMTLGSSGADIASAVTEPFTLQAGKLALLPTGLTVEIPEGYEIQIRPRSGLAAKHGVTVLNTPGTIDADYRGEIKVILINLSDTDFEITRGMRIAQSVLAEVPRMDWVEVESLEESDRGHGGFGHTGH